MKKLFGLAVLVALFFLALNYQIGGKTIKDHLLQLYSSPIMQEGFRQGKEAIARYLNKDVASPSSGGPAAGPAMEKLEDGDRKKLEEVLKKVH